MKCERCGGLVVAADFYDSRILGQQVEGWRCVNCGCQGDAQGRWGVKVGDEMGPGNGGPHDRMDKPFYMRNRRVPYGPQSRD